MKNNSRDFDKFIFPLFIISIFMGVGSLIIYLLLSFNIEIPFIHNYIKAVKEIYYLVTLINIIVLILTYVSIKSNYKFLIICCIFYFFINNYLAFVPTLLLFLIINNSVTQNLHNERIRRIEDRKISDAQSKNPNNNDIKVTVTLDDINKEKRLEKEQRHNNKKYLRHCKKYNLDNVNKFELDNKYKKYLYLTLFLSVLYLTIHIIAYVIALPEVKHSIIDDKEIGIGPFEIFELVSIGLFGIGFPLILITNFICSLYSLITRKPKSFIILTKLGIISLTYFNYKVASLLLEPYVYFKDYNKVMKKL